MTVTRSQFEAGMTYAQFKDAMTRNREQIEQHERELQLRPQDVDAFRALPRPLNVLALAEDWCSDVIDNLPILARLAEESGRLNVRILLRDQQPGSAVMDQYLSGGQFRSIPVFVFLDEAFNEVGVWVERPASVTEARARGRREIFARNPELGSPDAPIAELPEDARRQVMEAMSALRLELRPFASAETVRELREVAERAARTTAPAGA